jgi:hypothetical protein
MVSTGNIYDPLVSRAMAIANEDDIQEAIANLRARLQGEQYTQEHFGRLELQPASLVDINIDIQRLLEIHTLVKISLSYLIPGSCNHSM